jgi:hypothetical protein
MFAFLDSKVKKTDYGLMLVGILRIYVAFNFVVHFDLLMLFPNILTLPYFERVS